MFTGRYVQGLILCCISILLFVLAWLSYRRRLPYFSLLLFPPVLVLLIASVNEQGVIGLMWSYPAILLFYFVFRERWAWVANFVIIVVVVPLAAQNLESAVALRAVATLTLVSFVSIMAVRVIGSQQKRLESLAITDSLTGLLNRSLLKPTLDQSVSRFRRTFEPVSLLAIDVDLFKQVNDQHGHAKGDDVLVRVAELLAERLRASDVIFRTGGEEFVVVLPNTDAEPGLHVAQDPGNHCRNGERWCCNAHKR